MHGRSGARAAAARLPVGQPEDAQRLPYGIVADAKGGGEVMQRGVWIRGRHAPQRVVVERIATVAARSGKARVLDPVVQGGGRDAGRLGSLGEGLAGSDESEGFGAAGSTRMGRKRGRWHGADCSNVRGRIPIMPREIRGAAFG